MSTAMQQTLSEIASLLLEIERGKPWQYEQEDGVWSSPATQDLSPVTMVAGGCRIRLKPAEPDADGWIPWSGGECPVPYNVTVEYRMRTTPVTKGCAVASALCWWRKGKDTDIIAYRLHKPEQSPERPDLAGEQQSLEAEDDAKPDPHPNRAEVEEGIKQGKRWQYRTKGRNEPWKDDVVPPLWFPDFEYRLEPEPQYIPLGPEDVPPGSSIKHVEIEALVLRIGIEEVWILGRTGNPYPVEFEELKDAWQINRSLPFTGKWDPTAWESCRKLKGGDNA